MADPFVGEIKMTAFDFAPTGWASCDGQSLALQQNTALFALIGKNYGGNGTTNFCLPDLRGRVPVHRNYSSPSTAMYHSDGFETAAVALTQVPQHSHMLYATTEAGDSNFIAANGTCLLATSASANPVYSPSDATKRVIMSPRTCSMTGGGQPHTNMQPFTVLNFCIALVGLFPPRS